MIPAFFPNSSCKRGRKQDGQGWMLSQPHPSQWFSHPSSMGAQGWRCPGCAHAGAGAAPSPFPDGSAAGADSCLAPRLLTAPLWLPEPAR